MFNEETNFTSKPPLRIGIASPGRWGRKLLEAVAASSHLQFAGVFSRRLEVRTEIADIYRGKQFDSYAGLIADDSIEAIIIPTPHFLHFDQAYLALQNGKHVFVEKPVATSLAEAETLGELAEKKGLTLAVGHQARFTGAALQVQSMLKEGHFGQLASVVIVQGFPLLLNASPDSWRFNEANLPGGPLDEFGVHYFDALQFWFGPVRRVSGFVNRDLTLGRVPDSVTANLCFGDGTLVSYTAHLVSIGISRITFYGSKGALELNRFGDLPSFWQPITNMQSAREGGDVPRPVTFAGPHLVTTALQAELEDFAAAIREGRPPAVGGPEALATLRISRAVLESAQTGRTVEFPAP